MNASQFVRLARVPTLVATAVPVLVGGALAWRSGAFDILAWADVAVVALLMQVATNAMNEYGDFRHQVDTAPAPGFAGIIVRGEANARDVLASAVGCYVAAFVLGMALVWLRGLLMLGLGLAAILAGVLYSEGPLPVSSTPFGEPLVGAIMGPIEVVSSDLAASGTISPMALLFSVPVALMVTAILLTNNLRDVEKDRDHGRRTLAVIVGRRAGSTLLLVLMVCAFLWSIPAFAVYHAPESVFLVWLAFPLALRSYSKLMNGDIWPVSVPLIARLHILVGLLLTVSLLLA